MKCRLGFLVIFLSMAFLSCTNGQRKEDNKEETQTKKAPALKFNPKNYVCYRADAPLKIDGVLDEKAWEKAPWTDYFQDIEGDIKPAPRFKTRAKMLWDDEFFYVAAELEEPHVWGTLTQRDAVIFHDNDFEVFIDPNGDTHRYYEFEMNALNTVWDLMLLQPYRDRQGVLNNYDFIGMKSGVKVYGTLNDPSDEDEKWTVEIAFPLSALKECGNIPQEGTQWRVNFSRVQWRHVVEDGKYKKEINPETGKSYPEDNWVWSPQGVINMHCPETWGFVQFSDKVIGTGTSEFVWNKEEDVKWALRTLYYAQRRFASENKSYTSDVEVLKKHGFESEWPAEVFLTPSGYEAVIDSPFSEVTWHIHQHGRTWKTRK